MIFLIRTIEALIYPIGLTWALISLAAIILFRKKQRGAALVCLLFSLFLFIVGATPFPEFLMARLERPFAAATVAAAQPADAIVVLGGIMNVSDRDVFRLNFSPACDRLFTGMELLRQKKARALIIGGGSMGKRENRTSEGKHMAEFVKTWNIAPGEVIGLPGCLNTFDEAMNTKAVLAERKWTNILLVTSAYHMPRAMATFEKAGLNVRPVACDFEALPMLEGEASAFRVVPTIDHVQNFTAYMHEVIGWYYYAFRGWV